MSVLDWFKKKRQLEPGQRWKNKPNTPFSDWWIASVEAIRGDYVRYTATIAPECTENCVRKPPPIMDYSTISQFRSRYPDFVDDASESKSPS